MCGEFWPRKVHGFRAEFEVKGNRVGFMPIDLWGPGMDVDPPEGSTVEERVEV